MLRPDAPLRFKCSEETRQQLREMRHRFRKSATAIDLIDYARNTDVSLLDNTEILRALEWGGAYNHQNRTVEYRTDVPSVVICHELRHAPQHDVLEAEAPELLLSHREPNLRKAFMSVSVVETDACLFQDKVHYEMSGQSSSYDPLLYFRLFLSGKINSWLARTATENFRQKAALSFLRLSPLSDIAVEAECAYDRFLLKKWDREGKGIAPPCRAQKREDLEYLERLIDLVCRAPDGKNYFWESSPGGKTQERLDSLWHAIFTKDRMAAIHLSEHKDRQREKLSGIASRIPFFGTADLYGGLASKL
jgi:hypothetical protein